jgi:hypothetical protein
MPDSMLVKLWVVREGYLMHYLEIRLGNLWYHESPPRKTERVMFCAAVLVRCMLWTS